MTAETTHNRSPNFVVTLRVTDAVPRSAYDIADTATCAICEAEVVLSSTTLQQMEGKQFQAICKHCVPTLMAYQEQNIEKRGKIEVVKITEQQRESIRILTGCTNEQIDQIEKLFGKFFTGKQSNP